MRKLLIFLFFFISCYKEEPQVNDPNAIFNTQNWKVTLYVNNGQQSNVFNNFIFEFNDNPMEGCAEWMDGKSPLGVFGGYYDIIISDGLTKFNIILPPTFNLNQINGVWQVIIINSNTIHLKRFDTNQQIVFNR